MNKIINFFKNKWVIQFLGIIALSLLIWFVAPLIAILEPAIVRVVTILTIVLLWFAIALLIQVKASRANAQMVDDLAVADSNEQNAADLNADQEVDELKDNFDSALLTLKKSSSKTSQGK
ncbi:MAG: type VI secretion system membrane subunit TssM, partial [Methylococcales bacterium]|nr:type VI secretion system membrane subunit TssM [Methylococcales bacterium]